MDEDYYSDSYWKFYFQKTPEGREEIMNFRNKNMAMDKEFRTEFLSSIDGKKMVQDKLVEIGQELIGINEAIEIIHKNKALADDKDDFLYELRLERLNQEHKRFYRYLKLFRYWQFLQENDNFEEIDGKKSFSIDEVKQVPIGDIMMYPPHREEINRDFYLCPIHSERTPSFVVYKNDNKFYCFGCNRHGSVIDLYMELYQTDFIGACSALTQL